MKTQIRSENINAQVFDLLNIFFELILYGSVISNCLLSPTQLVFISKNVKVHLVYTKSKRRLHYE